MADEDTEITLGAGKLLGLFFMLAAVCGIFFAVGFSLGKTSAREQVLKERAVADERAAASVPELSSNKPIVSPPASAQPASAGSPDAEKQPEPDLTFYKAVRQPAADASLDSPAKEAAPAKPVNPPAAKTAAATVPPAAKPELSTPQTTAAVRSPVAPGTAPGSTTATAGSNFLVQIAAVTHEEDAAALAGALRKKSYAASVVNNPTGRDKLYHVVIGPYATLQDAEAMKARLQGEGYNPIVKR